MDSKRVIILGTVLLLLFTLGCAQGTRARDAEPTRGVNYRTGTQGITLQFPSGTIDRVFENDRFDMIVEVRNEGAFPQYYDRADLNGFIWTGGFDTNLMQLIPEIRRLDDRELEGRSQYNPDGGYSSVVLSGETFTLPRGTQFIDIPLIISVTYEYETIASSIVCVDPDPFSTVVRDKVCRVQQRVAVQGSQGAPVAITSIEQDVTSDALLFKIFVENQGKGVIIDENDIQRDPNIGYDQRSLHRVRIADISVGNLRMSDCRPSIGDFIELRNNKGFIFCRLDKAGIVSVYSTPLNIRLQYAYLNSIQHNLQIFEAIR